MLDRLYIRVIHIENIVVWPRASGECNVALESAKIKRLYTNNSIITRGSIGLPGTDDPLKVKEYRVFLRIRVKERPDN